jgi:hypothetical protein
MWRIQQPWGENIPLNGNDKNITLIKWFNSHSELTTIYSYEWNE